MKWVVNTIIFSAIVSNDSICSRKVSKLSGINLVGNGYLVKVEQGEPLFSSMYSDSIIEGYQIGSTKIYLMNKVPSWNCDNIENNYVVSINSPTKQHISVADAKKVQNNPEWHLDRIDQRKLPLDHQFRYNESAGSGVDVYIVDTGIDVSHPQFGDRATWAFNAVDDYDKDCNDHGTHVAGLVGSSDYGVAKKVNLKAVKVLNCQGSGTYSSILKGLEFVANNHNSSRHTIINMSLGGPKSDILNSAVRELTGMGIHVVVAAGNENQNACNTSPASDSSVITVGATDIHDRIAWFSNWGPCVDILGPGVDILSTIPNSRTEMMSGTSQSSPKVAGTLALLLSSGYQKEHLFSNSTKGVIKGLRSNTVNSLVYTL